MKLYIPRLGDTLWLTKHWTFTLHSEPRNKTLAEALKVSKVQTVNRWGDPIMAYPAVNVRLEARTGLVVDRIYIRKNQREFDSASFTVVNLNGTGFIKKNKPRFWAKLDDVNTMDFISVAPVELRDEKTQPQTDVHTEHCCVRHGCKYGYDRGPNVHGLVCTVATRQLVQSYECEDCEWTDD